MKDPFIDESIRKDWSGEPIEYVKPDFIKPHGMQVKEVTMDEWLEEFTAFKAKVRGAK